VDVDDAGFVYVAGIVADDVDFDPSVNEVIRTGHPNGSAFLACYANNGDLQFAFALEGSRSVASDVATTAEGKSVIAGFISGVVDLDPDTSAVLVDAAGGTDVFAARYSTSGKYILGYTLPGGGLNRASAVDLNAEEGHVITGSFSGVLDMDPGAGVDERVGAGQTDAFMARYPAALIVSNDPEAWTDMAVGATAEIRMSAPYPNPASDEVHLALRAASTQQVVVSLYDLVGRRVAAAKQLTIAAGVTREFVISTHDLTAGIYFIVAQGDQIRDVQKVVVIKR
jgi:hypothetical protein